MDDLLRRVVRLEAENRRLRRAAVAIALLVAVPLLVAAAPRRGSVFKVNTLQVLDADGRVRAKLTVENGQPGLLLLDEKGVIRTAHCALGWLRADASGRRTASAGKPSCLPSEPAEAPPPKKPFAVEKE